MSSAANCTTAPKRGIARALLATFVLAAALTGSGVTLAATSSAPLLQQSNLKYLGSFPLTNKAGTGSCSNSRAGYGGAGLSYYKDPSTGKGTLFMEGNAQVPGCIGQFEIPSSMGTTAPQLQNFQDIAEGKWNSVSTCGAGCPTGGLLVYNGKLFVDAFEYYGDSQKTSHGYSGINLSTSGDFKGWYSVTPTAGNLRTTAGWMAPVPSEWQSSLGGPALTGNCCQAIISASSAGPSISVFNPDDLLNGSAKATTLIYYPLSSPLCGAVNCDQSQNDLYNWTTHIGGVAFPPGSRSLLFIGGHGTGKFCYGLPQDCGVSGNSKGPFAPPYRYQVWAYDVNDMIAVKNGTKTPSQIKPYAVWTLPELPNQDISIQIAGATYDPDLQRIYITPHYGENPIVYVYQVSFVAAAVPSPPSNVSVK